MIGSKNRFLSLLLLTTLINVGGGMVLQEPLSATTVPGSATSFSASGSGSQCSLNFSINDGGDTIINYSYSFDNSTFIEFNPPRPTKPLIFTQDFYRASGLASSQSIYIYIKAINGVGTGPSNWSGSSGSRASCSTGNLAQSTSVAASTAPSGTKSDGQTLTSQVSFNGYPTPTKTYRWQRCTSDSDLSSCQDISSATAETYVATSSDVGKFLRTIVVGTSGATSATGTSSLTTVITSVPDTTPPTVTGVTSTNGTYKAGDTITILVAMSEAVIVTGTPTLALDTTPTSRNATYVSGSGTNSLTFTYIVQATDTAADLNYAATSSLSGTIKDASDNSATLTLPGLASAGSLATNQSIVIDTTAPTQTISGIDISADTGSSASDFTTSTASQTITATLSAGLGAGETLWGSVNGGTTYTDISASVSTTAVSWASATLSGSSSIKFQVRDAAGNAGETATQNYVLDTTAPTQTITAIDISADTGSSASDFTTSTASQTITATLSAGLGTGETLWGSVNGGTTYTDISASVSTTAVSWASATLSGSSSIKFQVRDLAGNTGTTATQAYILDITAPALTLAATAATSGSVTVTFTVTGNEAIDCSTLSTTSGADFTYTGISALSGIAQTSPTVCTITAVSTATLLGDTATATITAASSFSMADTAGNAQTTLTDSPKSTLVTITDTTAPVISLASASAITYTSADINFTSDEAGTYYYLIYAASDGPPDAATIVAQGTAIAKGTTSAIAAANIANATTLTAGTAYKAYVIVKDAANNSSAVSTVAFMTQAIAPVYVAPVCNAACEAAAAKVIADKIASDAAAKVVADTVAVDKSAAEAAAKAAVDKAAEAVVKKTAADLAAANAAVAAKAAADEQQVAVVAAEKAEEALKSATTSAAAKAAATTTAVKAASTAVNTVKAAAAAAKSAATAKVAMANASKPVDIAIGQLGSKSAATASAEKANTIAAAAKVAANKAANTAVAKAKSAKAVSDNASKAAAAATARIATEQKEAADAATDAQIAADLALKATNEKIAAATEAQKSADAVVKALEEKIALAEASVKAKDIAERAAIDKKMEEITAKVSEAQKSADAANTKAESTSVAQEKAQSAAETAAQIAQTQSAEVAVVKIEAINKTAAATTAAEDAGFASKIATAAVAAAAKIPGATKIIPKPTTSATPSKNSAKATVTGLKPGQKIKVTVNVKGKK